MRNFPLGRQLGISLACLAALACQAASGTKHNSGGSGSTGHPVGGHVAAGGADAGGTSSVPSDSLTLTAVNAQVDGRRGNRVRFSISGHQTIGKFASVAITAFDSTENTINYFKTDLTGSYDSATGYFVPQSTPNAAAFSFDILVPITSELLDWKKAEVYLVDRSDAVSNKVSVDIQSQPVRTQGASCDSASKSDRCADGLECDGKTSTCIGHQGPSLIQVGYYTTNVGPLLIASGTDAMDDVMEMRINFYDASGSPVNINITNDSTNPTMVSSFDETGGIGDADGSFVFRINPSTPFTQTVKQVRLTPVDAQRKQGSSLTSTLQPQPSRGSGAACDYSGFNYCSGSSACVPGIAGANNACVPIGSAQSSACRNAPTLTPEPGFNLVTGYVIGSSLWEPPISCVPDTALHNPEFIAKLHLAKATPSITISTNRRETQIDTVLYVASACSPNETQILACNDDLLNSSTASSITLTNLSAGDYYVIVDSRTGAEGSVGLQVSVP